MRHVWQRYRIWRRRHVAELELTDGGFVLHHGRRSARVEWGKIKQIVALKRDLLAVDLLCLLILADDAAVEIHEDMAGYGAVESALINALDIGFEWKTAVLFPAFATNPTTIFERGEA